MRKAQFAGTAMMIFMAASAIAEEAALTGNEITALLPTIRALGQTTSQTFGEGGSTTYTENGNTSFGRWWIEGDQYCSSWPPASSRACYEVRRDGDRLFWIGESGNRLENRIEPK